MLDLGILTGGYVANIEDLDRMPRSAEFDLGLHCVLRCIFPNTYGKFG